MRRVKPSWCCVFIGENLRHVCAFVYKEGDKYVGYAFDNNRTFSCKYTMSDERLVIDHMTRAIQAVEEEYINRKMLEKLQEE